MIIYCFANCKASPTELLVILRSYEEVSGQSVNLAKSAINEHEDCFSNQLTQLNNSKTPTCYLVIRKYITYLI